MRAQTTVLALCVTALATTAATAPAPSEVASDKHRFKVRFAAAPQFMVHTTSAGNLVDRWRLDDPSGLFTFMDVAPTADSPAPDVLANVVESWKKQASRVISDAAVTVDGVQGRDLLVALDATTYVRGRFFVRDMKLYQVYGGAAFVEGAALAEVRRSLAPVGTFVESFRFVGAALAAPVAVVASSPDVVSEKHAFRARFAQAPKVGTRTTPAGTSIDYWRHDDTATKVSLSIDVSEVSSDPAAEVLARVVAGLMKDARTILNEEATVDGVRGHDLFVVLEGATYLRGRYFVRNGKLYQIYGSVESPSLTPEAARRMLSPVEATIGTFRFIGSRP
jgi:hypothetical protein